MTVPTQEATVALVDLDGQRLWTLPAEILHEARLALDNSDDLRQKLDDWLRGTPNTELKVETIREIIETLSDRAYNNSSELGQLGWFSGQESERIVSTERIEAAELMPSLAVLALALQSLLALHGVETTISLQRQAP